MLGGFGTDQRVAALVVRVDAVGHLGAEPRNEPRHQDRADEDQDDLEAVAARPAREVVERRNGQDHADIFTGRSGSHAVRSNLSGVGARSAGFPSIEAHIGVASHMTKADVTSVTVKLDSNFKVTATEAVCPSVCGCTGE